MLPTTGVVGFPPRGFRPTTRHLVGGLHANRGPMVRRLSLLQHGAVSRLAHAALILGEPRARHPESEQGVSHPPWGGQHQMYPASMGRFGTSLLSAVGAATVDGSRVRGRITAARANEAVWTERTRNRQRARAQWFAANPTRFLPRLKPWVSALLNYDKRCAVGNELPGLWQAAEAGRHRPVRL